MDALQLDMPLPFDHARVTGMTMVAGRKEAMSDGMKNGALVYSSGGPCNARSAGDLCMMVRTRHEYVSEQ